MLRLLIRFLILVSPLLLLLFPLPFSAESGMSHRTLVLCGCGAVLLVFAGQYFADRVISSRLTAGLFSAVVIVSAGLSLLINFAVNPAWFSVLLAVIILLLWGGYISAGGRLAAGGFLGLMLTVSSFLVFEDLTREIPRNFFVKELIKVPPLVPSDRGNMVYRKNGFRGQRPCTDCPENLLRIFTMGGSSTYGIPMYYSQETYSAKLQRILDSRRPAENYEVLNAGIPGYGIMQIVDSIEQEILKHKPDIISVCAWFNDSSALPSWYGMADKSDRESYQAIKVLKFVDAIPGVRPIYKSGIFKFFRFYLLSAQNLFYRAFYTGEGGKKRPNRKPRMSPADFEWGLNQVVKLSEKYDFLPVLIYEPLHRSSGFDETVKGRKYYDAVKRVAEENDLPLVDTLTPYSRRSDEWLFYDFIHPNEAGHEITAEAIYRTLFADKTTERAQAFLKGRNIDLTRPDAREEYRYQFPAETVSGKKMSLIVRAPYAGPEGIDLEITANGAAPVIIGGAGSEFKEFTAELPGSGDSPIADVQIRAAVNEKLTGKSPYPAHLSLKSGGKNFGWFSEIKVNRRSYVGNFDGYSVAVIGAGSGQVKSVARFKPSVIKDGDSGLAAYIKDSVRYAEEGVNPVLAIVLKTDGYEGANQEALSEAFRLAGGSGKTPGQFESFAMIGAVGMQPGTAIEESGSRFLKLSAGDPEISTRKLIEIRAIEFR